jgi:hypothetical protein
MELSDHIAEDLLNPIVVRERVPARSHGSNANHFLR